MVMKHRKKPVVIKAVQWTGENREEIRTFCTHGAFFLFLLGKTRKDVPRSGAYSLTTLKA